MTDFTFHTLETAPEASKSMLTQIKEVYGFVPNLFAYMAEAPASLEAYLTLNKLIESTSFTPAQQQVALLAVSVENQCEFCSVAHRATGKMKQANQQTLDALNSGKEIQDKKDSALAAFSQAVVETRGRPGEETIEKFLNSGFTKQNILEVMLIVAIKTLSNYTNHLTLPEPNPELLSML